MKWIREHALTLLSTAATALGIAIVVIAFLYNVVAFKLPAIEEQLAGIRKDLHTEMARTQGVDVVRLTKIEGAITALRASLLDLRIKLKKPPNARELKELVSTVDDFGKAQSENFLEANIVANARDLPTPPRWTADAFRLDFMKSKPNPTARSREDIGKVLAFSLVTPDTRWEVSGTKLKATYPKGYALFTPSTNVDVLSLKKLATQFNALSDSLDDISQATPDSGKEKK